MSDVQAVRNALLDHIRSNPALYRVAKWVQPAYFKWLSINAAALRVLMATPAVTNLVQNPTRTTNLAVLAQTDQHARRAGVHAVVLYPEIVASRQLPKGMPAHCRRVFAGVRTARSGAGAIFVFSRGRAWGSGGAIVSRDRRLVGDLSPVIRVPSEAHPIFRRPIIRKPRRMEGRIAVVTGPSPDNLSHWLFGILPRISLLSRWDPGLTMVDAILAPEMKTEFQAECFDRFGIPRPKMIAAHPGTFVEANEIIAPSFASPAYVAPRWFLNDLRQRFEDVRPARGVPRIYVSRKRAPGRRVKNEDAVATLLASYGFSTVQLERMPFLEQVALFKGAEIVVAAHGAGLSHLAFARVGTLVVELFSSSYINPMYWCLADELGLHYSCCVGCPSDDRVQHDLVRSDITVDVSELRATLQSLIA